MTFYLIFIIFVETDSKPAPSGPNVSVLDSPKGKNVKQKIDSKRNSRNSSPSVKRTASPSVKRNQLNINERASSSNRSSPTPQHNVSSSGKKLESSVKQPEPKYDLMNFINFYFRLQIICKNYFLQIERDEY